MALPPGPTAADYNAYAAASAAARDARIAKTRGQYLELGALAALATGGATVPLFALGLAVYEGAIRLNALVFGDKAKEANTPEEIERAKHAAADFLERGWIPWAYNGDQYLGAKDYADELEETRRRISETRYESGAYAAGDIGDLGKQTLATASDGKVQYLAEEVATLGHGMFGGSPPDDAPRSAYGSGAVYDEITGANGKRMDFLAAVARARFGGNFDTIAKAARDSWASYGARHGLTRAQLVDDPYRNRHAAIAAIGEAWQAAKLAAIGTAGPSVTVGGTAFAAPVKLASAGGSGTTFAASAPSTSSVTQQAPKESIAPLIVGGVALLAAGAFAFAKYKGVI